MDVCYHKGWAKVKTVSRKAQLVDTSGHCLRRADILSALRSSCPYRGHCQNTPPVLFRTTYKLGFLPPLHNLPQNRWHSNPNRSSTPRLSASRCGRLCSRSEEHTSELQS